MLAYRHHFHAGNIGDVLKHTLLAFALQELLAKPTPWVYLDTHAGAGLYRFDRRLGGRAPSEWRSGIGKLWGKRSEAPRGFAPYRALLEALNPDGVLRRYPGSPLIARLMQRASFGDQLLLLERHPSDVEALRRVMHGVPHCQIWCADAYKALPQLVARFPRGVILIDPSYELERDYFAVVRLARALHERFAHATMIIWYPLVRRYEVPILVRRLTNIAPEKHCLLELAVAPIPREGFGLYGSGAVVINPPFRLREAGRALLTWLYEQLAEVNAQAPRWVWQSR